MLLRCGACRGGHGPPNAGLDAEDVLLVRECLGGYIATSKEQGWGQPTEESIEGPPERYSDYGWRLGTWFISGTAEECQALYRGDPTFAPWLRLKRVGEGYRIVGKVGS